MFNRLPDRIYGMVRILHLNSFAFRPMPSSSAGFSWWETWGQRVTWKITR